MKRFYDKVEVVAADGGWGVALDGRRVKTVAGAEQTAPNRAIAEDMAVEWARQGEKIDPFSFRLRDLADYAIDKVATDRDGAIAKLLTFAETDTLCYRAEAGTALADRQQEAWEPLLAAVERRHDVKFMRTEAIALKAQPEGTLATLRSVLRGHDDFTLSALLTLAGLAGSLCVALTVLDGDEDAKTLFAAANLEEDWQAGLWGWDTEALEAREDREGAFVAAANFARLAANG